MDFSQHSPNVISAHLHYKRNRFTITPAVTFNEGQLYGNPSDVEGIDPRVCKGNSAEIPTAPRSTQANYTTCGLSAVQNGSTPGVLYIPNPDTGTFDGFGSFRQPNQLNLSLQVGYQLTPRVKVNFLLANLVNACFGGSTEPWTKQFPPNSYTCGYVSGGPTGTSYYVSNFYNGSSPNDRKANGVPLNPAFAQPFTPAYADTNSLVLPNPFNAFLQFNITL
ncbi:MAG: hypothetical protein JO190_07865 [Candidatus Eremiobacteraeota bacterium]|nr:hypothetical protein [Candidatus Eremiobacteraeota bacterium]